MRTITALMVYFDKIHSNSGTEEVFFDWGGGGLANGEGLSLEIL
jgi:hypothetical protein